MTAIPSTEVPPDACGIRHHPAGPGARIVSLVPSITELLFDLGLGGQVVGRTTFCIHPRERVDAVRRVGGTKTPNLERIATLDASHVIVNLDENRREDADALAAQGLTVVATHPLGPQDNVALYRLIGAVFDRAPAAESLVTGLRAALARLHRAAAARSRRRVLYLIWRDPWMTVSADTYIARTLAEAGLDTIEVAAPGRYPQLDARDVDWERVDAVLLSSEPYPFKAGHADEVRALAGRPDLAVTFIDGEMTSWYGSRALAGCRYLETFHPLGADG